jgi:non-specific serine/threonine protein kinase
MDERASRQSGDHQVSGAPDTWPLSARDAAQAAGVSERTIRRAIARGDLPAIKRAGVYQIDPAALAHYRSPTTQPVTIPGRTGIPYPITPLIGRTDERAAARELLLREGARLVTLTGPGGVGKTRLALAISREIAEVFADGVYFVDLSPVRDTHLVLPAIAQTLGLRDTGRRGIDASVLGFLHPRELLLVLDNFEQVIEAATRIAHMLSACPNLHILATSRVPLGLRGEYRFPVDPLTLPVSAKEPEAVLADSDAVQLFLERARAIDPGAGTTGDHLRAIAEICRRLDGLPLAIELAAAWSALLPPVDLLAQLPDRMRVPGSGPRDLPSRQRTMRDTVAWSYDLLPPEVQELFRSLAVFVHGFDLEAVTAIADAPAGVVLGRLGVLVEQSLVRRVERSGDSARYAMLETVREFAGMQLDALGETGRVRGRHAEHYLLLAEHIETVIYGSEMRHYLDRLEEERPNGLSALAYFVETGDATRELRLAGMLSEYWFYRGQLSEGITALQGALDREADSPPGPRARVRSELAVLVWAAGKTQLALDLIAESMSLVRQTGDTYRIAQTQYVMAEVVRNQAGWEREAIALLKEVLELLRDQQPAHGLYPSAMVDLGDLWLLLGDRARGTALLEEALAMFQALGNQLGIGQGHLRLGRLARRDGKPRVAAGHNARSLRAYRESGIVTHAGLPLAELGKLVAISGYAETTARISGMLQALSESSGASYDGDWTIPHLSGEPVVAGTDAPEAFAAGRALSFDDAIAEAISIAEALAAGNPPPGGARPRPPGMPPPLSTREHHVLALLAQRYTAPEIADQLYLSVRTVERHVSNVYNKLGVNSRRAAVDTATQHGLV